MNFDDISPELREKVLACKSEEELIQIAEEHGMQLTDEQVTAISGGGYGCPCDDFAYDCGDYVCALGGGCPGFCYRDDRCPLF